MRWFVHLLRLTLALLLVMSSGVAAWAQSGRPEIDIRMSSTMFPPVIAVRGVLAERPFDELLRSGFPGACTCAPSSGRRAMVRRRQRARRMGSQSALRRDRLQLRGDPLHQ